MRLPFRVDRVRVNYHRNMASRLTHKAEKHTQKADSIEERLLADLKAQERFINDKKREVVRLEAHAKKLQTSIVKDKIDEVTEESKAKSERKARAQNKARSEGKARSQTRGRSRGRTLRTAEQAA